VPAQLTGVVATRVLAVLRTLARIRDAARWGLVAGLLLVLGAVAVSPVRRQTLLNAGLGLLAVAAMLALLVPLGRAAVTGPIHDPTLRTVAGDVWLTFSAGLLQWAVGLAAVALMMTATVAAFVAPARLAQLAARSWHEVAGRQPTAGREWLRIVFLLVLGGFAVAEPLSTLSAATVVLGLVVLAIAVYGLVALVAPDVPSEGAETLALRLNPALTLAVGGVTLMAGALGAVAVVPRLRPAPLDVATSPVLACNGAAELCDRPFDRVTLAGAHNAMGSADNPHWMFPNQDANIAALLDRGVRALLIDVTHGHPVGDRIKTDFQSEEQRRKYEAAIGPEAFAAAMRVRDRLIGEGGETGLYMCHGFCELGAIPFDTALAQLKAFLDTHPSEVVLVVIEDRAEGAEIVGAFERQGLARYAYPGPWTAPFPTLRDMIARGQRLVVLGENVADTTSWYRPAYGVMQETPYTFHRPEDFSCRPNRGGARNPLFLMNHWIETTPAPKPSNAALVNAERVLVDRARACRRTRGRLPTVLAVDFAATGDVVRAAQVLNGLVEPTRPAGSR
ncbi:MAG TPA: hypothetical protein VFX50_01330, partial [Gemmatimonadales bacterium]|nr:hypothetical protein [Gemmatimonadales bacterium]